MREVGASGLRALALASSLLHRVRLADPTAGIWEAADLQWWWRTPRRSDAIAQRFWLDGDQPVAAVLLTEWRHAWGFDPIVAPDAREELRSRVWSTGVERIDSLGLGRVETRVRDDDPALAAFLRSAGFEATDERDADTWMEAADRPAVPALPEGFSLVDRLSCEGTAHPMTDRNGPDVERRLRQVPLYDPALDLSIRAPSGEAAAYALFWFDDVTRVGMVEPMRTEDAWQRHGLARALLAAGLERLARRGAIRLKVAYSSEPARRLYLSAGFREGATTTVCVRSVPGGD